MRAAAEIAGVQARGRLFRNKPVLYAFAAFLAAAYFFFLITHVPQAAGTNGVWPIDETEALRVIGPRAGQLLTMTFRGEGLASVSAGGGSRIVQPDDASLGLLKTLEPEFAALPAGSRVDLRIDNDEGSLASVSVLLDDSSAGEATVEIQPDPGTDETGMRLQASGAPMTVTVDWSSPGQAAQQKGPLLVGKDGRTLPLSRAVISIPEGKTLYIGGPTGKTAFEIGSHRDRLSPGGLDLKGLQIAGQEQGPVTSAACGASKLGKLGWPGPLGGFGLNACRQALHVQDLKLGDQSSIAMSGPAFFMKSGAVHYWPLLPNLMSNLVIQFALTSVVGGFIGWVAFSLGLKRASAALSEKPKRDRRARASN